MLRECSVHTWKREGGSSYIRIDYGDIMLYVYSYIFVGCAPLLVYVVIGLLCWWWDVVALREFVSSSMWHHWTSWVGFIPLPSSGVDSSCVRGWRLDAALGFLLFMYWSPTWVEGGGGARTQRIIILQTCSDAWIYLFSLCTYLANVAQCLLLYILYAIFL